MISLARECMNEPCYVAFDCMVYELQRWVVLNRGLHEIDEIVRITIMEMNR